jgi:hypothetical protein
MITRAQAEQYVDRIVVDMSNQGIAVVTDEFRIRLNKNDQSMEVTWRGSVDQGQVPDAREYFMTLAQSELGR